MSTRNEIVKRCDMCGQEKRYEPAGGFYGGHPLAGWLELREHGGSTALHQLDRKLEHDFCGRGCLGDFLDGYEVFPA